MPRRPRISFENAFFHVFNRGVIKQEIFREDQDYHHFLQRLKDLKIKKHYDHAIYAYILMPNHFHLLLQIKKTPISKIMSSLLTSYSMYFNRKYKRSGVVFENRFKSKLCDKDSYFLGASRYILLNPIEAGFVKDLKDYPWSSFQELFGQSQYSIIDPQEIVRIIGEKDQDKESYKRFLYEGIEHLEDLRGEFGSFNHDIEGGVRFKTLSQKKYLRRRLKTI